jgi:hypothetical protein
LYHLIDYRGPFSDEFRGLVDSALFPFLFEREFEFTALMIILDFIFKAVKTFQFANHFPELAPFVAGHLSPTLLSEIQRPERCALFTKIVSLCTMIINLDFTFVPMIATTGVVDRIIEYIHDEGGILTGRFFNISLLLHTPGSSTRNFTSQVKPP